MGIQTTMSVTDGDPVATGTQIYPGQTVSLTINTQVFGDDYLIPWDPNDPNQGPAISDIAIRLYNSPTTLNSTTLVATINLGPQTWSLTGDTNSDGIIDIGETFSWTSTFQLPTDLYTLYPAAVSAKFAATVSTNDQDGDLEASSSTSGALVVLPEAPNPSLQLTKTADVENVDAAGDVINYTFAVSNTGNVALSNVSVDDPLLTEVAPLLNGDYNIGDTDMDDLLDIDETWNFTGSYTVTQADLDGNGEGDGDIDNTATVSGSYGDQNVSDNDSVAVMIQQVVESFEGLSQGYWSQHKPNLKTTGKSYNIDAEVWKEVADSTLSETFENYFLGGQKSSINWTATAKGKNITVGDIKLTEAIDIGGGGQNALARDAVAAVLNATRDDVNYKYSVGQIKDMVIDAFGLDNDGIDSWNIDSLQHELSINNNLGLGSDYNLAGWIL